MAAPACAPDTPEAGVKRYWVAVAEGDANKLLQTMVVYQPGMSPDGIWTVNDIEWLYLDSITTAYRGPGRAVVYYQVVFKKKAQACTTRYFTGTTAILRNGRWMVGGPAGVLRSRPPESPRQEVGK